MSSLRSGPSSLVPASIHQLTLSSSLLDSLSSLFVNTEITCLNDIRNRNLLKFKPRTRNEFRRRLEQLLRLWLSTTKPNEMMFKTIHRLVHAAVHPISDMNNKPIEFESVSNIIICDRADICHKPVNDAQMMKNRDIEHMLIYYLTELIYEELTSIRLHLEHIYGLRALDLDENSTLFMHPLFYNDNEAIARLRNPVDVVEELYLKQFKIRDEYKVRMSAQPSYKLVELQLKEIEEHERELKEREQSFALCFNSAPYMTQELFKRAQALSQRERAFEDEMKFHTSELEKKYEEYDKECEAYELESTKWKANQEHMYLVKTNELKRREQALNERERILNEREQTLIEFEEGLLKSKIEMKSLAIQTNDNIHSDNSSSESTTSASEFFDSLFGEDSA